MDQERRIRREIANSNERRRMQSINSGFQSLRTLLPHHEGEKLSKVRTFDMTNDVTTVFIDAKYNIPVESNRQLRCRNIFSDIYFLVVFL